MFALHLVVKFLAGLQCPRSKHDREVKRVVLVQSLGLAVIQEQFDLPRVLCGCEFVESICGGAASL